MQDAHECRYKGHAITVRCTESNLPHPDGPLVYAVSFSVHSEGCLHTCWQEFLTLAFLSPEDASACALRAAKVSVDQKPRGDTGFDALMA
ncbi:MAG: hypothetical protein RLZZ618_2827 [Pseudomonadota bacterium]|jgi:hypothetical protein